MLNLDKNKKYLLACSYGPDSMALFNMLLKEGYNFEVAHVNYHFRIESDQEEKDLREYCLKNNIKIHVLDNKEKVTKNLEAKARDIRYKFFEKIYKDNGFDYLLVAHHQDDLLETYLMQIKRDLHSNTYGLARFSSAFNMDIIRPLLDCTKAILLEYCGQNNIPYSIDKTNLEDNHERNKIRHEVIEKLTDEERYNLLREIKFKNEAVREVLKNIEFVDVHNAYQLSRLNEIEIIYAIQTLANNCQIFKISKANMNEIIKIIRSKKPNVFLQYKDYAFLKEYDYVTFANYDEECSYSYTIEEPGKLDTPYFYLDFTNGASDRNVKDEDYPLTIRNADKKDKVKIKDYYKEARRLFIDWKMPMSLRNRWPVIINKNGEVIYIPRYQRDFEVGKNLNFYVK